MAVLVSAHAEIIRRRLYAGALGRYDLLNGAISSTSATTLVVTDGSTGYANGHKLAIDSEIMLVRSYNSSTKTVTVVRGFLGTTAATHVDGSLVELDPRFPLADITDTMREEIEGWSPQLFRIVTASFNTVSDLRAYNLTAAVNPLFLLEVTQQNSTWTSAENSRSAVRAQLLRDQATADFASGYAVQLLTRPQVGVPLVVVWAEPLATSTWATTVDLLATVGLQQGWLDILTYGVLWRLLSSREVARTDLHGSGETRRAEEVPPLYAARTTGELLKLRDRRLADEANALRGRYPYRWL